MGLHLLLQMKDQVKLIYDRMKVARDSMNSFADLKERCEEFKVGDQNYYEYPLCWCSSFWCSRDIESQIYWPVYSTKPYWKFCIMSSMYATSAFY